MSTQALRSASLLSGMTALIFLVACGGKQDAPAPLTSAPVQPAQPLVVQGQILHSITGKAVPGAKVDITRTDGTWLASLAAASDGTFGLDVSAEPSTELKVQASAEGYGFSGTLAQLDKATNSARIPTLTVAPIATTQQTLGVMGGSLIANHVADTTTGHPLRADLPQGALAANTAVSLAPLASADLLPFEQVATRTLTAFHLGTAGQGLSRAAVLTCPLPFQAAPGHQLNVYRLDPATKRWQAVPQKAVVDGPGTTARLEVAQEGTYAVAADLPLQIETASAWVESPLVVPGDSKVFSLLKGSQVITLENQVSVTYLVKAGSAPVDPWLANLLKLSFGASDTYSVRHRLNYPQLPADCQAGGKQINPARPGEPGYWEYRWYYESYALPSKVATLGFQPFFSVRMQVDETRWRLTSKTGWYWNIITGPTGGLGL